MALATLGDFGGAVLSTEVSFSSPGVQVDTYYLVSDWLVVSQLGVDQRCPLWVPDPLPGRISPS